MPDFINSLWKEASTGIIGLLCTGLGILAKAAWDRWISERIVSTQALLDRLADNQQGLSSGGRKRLQEEAEASLNEWRRRLVPFVSGEKLRDWPKNSEVLFARELKAPEGSSACPVSNLSEFSSPLFIRLESSNNISNRYDSLTAANESGRLLEGQVTKELRERFVKIADDVKFSDKLVKVANWHKGNEPKLWIFAPEISIHTSDDAYRLLQKLAEEARSWIPGVRLVLEVYMPDIVREQLNSSYQGVVISQSGDVIAKDDDINLSSSAARYAAARNEAQDALNTGLILGELQRPDKYSIPEEVINQRLHKRFDILSSYWTALTISGAPGSGKTETTRLLLKSLATTYSAIVLVFSTPELLGDLETLRKNQNREEVYFRLARAFCFRERLVPVRFQGNDESLKAFMDALFQKLRDEKRRQPFVFVVDDLHAQRREVREVLSNLRIHAGAWKFRFVLIGRSEIEPYEKEDHMTIRCEPWNRSQAQNILTEWVETERHKDIEIALSEGWLLEQEIFSIYLLRVIAENIDDLTRQRTKPSILLRNAIDKHLSSVSLEIRSHPQESSDLLINIEEMLRTGASHDEILRVLKKEEKIDLIQLLGILSWGSHFEAQDNILTENKIKRWSQGFISTDREAKDLLEAGGKAGVFSVFYGAAMWHDKLVADGCAALYLGHKVEEENELTDSLIAEMIESLNRSDSIDILTLALDTPVLLRIIEAIANAKPGLAAVINKLVTTEFSLQLKRNPKWLFELWQHLWKRGRNTRGSDTSPFALVLARLLPLEPKFETICRDAIAKGSDDAVLAVAVKAAQMGEVERFLQELEEYAPSYLALVIAEAAARFCVISSGEALHSYLAKSVDFGFKESDIGRVWELWCSQQSTEDILIAVNAFINQTRGGTVYENVYRQLTDISLREIVAHRPPSERAKYLQQINQLKNEVVDLARRKKKLASVLAKWIAYFYNPDIVDKEDAWIVVTGNTNYALPKRPNEPLYVSQIFAKIRNSYPHLELAAVGELRHVQKSNAGHPELIRDRLPSGFAYTEEEIRGILPVNLGICGEQPSSENFVSKDKLNSMELVWRPRLDLKT